MLAFPLHPRYARMLIAAQDYGCVYQACLLAALTQGRDLLLRNVDGDTARPSTLNHLDRSEDARLSAAPALRPYVDCRAGLRLRLSGLPARRSDSGPRPPPAQRRWRHRPPPRESPRRKCQQRLLAPAARLAPGLRQRLPARSLPPDRRAFRRRPPGRSVIRR